MIPTHWPRWIVIPLGLALVAAVIGLGLILVPAVQSSATSPKPTATPPRLAYAAPLSGECAACHTDKAKLTAAAASGDKLEALYIEPDQTESLHGRLGCITCHKGTANTADATAAHTGLVDARSPYLQDNCLFCHRDVPNELPARELLAPHAEVISGAAKDLTCSDCHGAAGHGYDPVSGDVIVKMDACIACHEERGLSVECTVCHTGDVGFNPKADCSSCHAPSYAESMQDPTMLAYAHVKAQANLTCLDCHEVEALTELHKGVGTDTSKLKQKKYPDTFCLDCHVANQHSSYEQIIERTKDYTSDAGEKANPHNPHEGSESMASQQFPCSDCHRVHKTSPLIKHCYGCHHAENLEPCKACHAE